MTVCKKKLIEVALPLEAINQAIVREKSIRHGHLSTLHSWWARRPLADRIIYPIHHSQRRLNGTSRP